MFIYTVCIVCGFAKGGPQSGANAILGGAMEKFEDPCNKYPHGLPYIAICTHLYSSFYCSVALNVFISYCGVYRSIKLSVFH